MHDSAILTSASVLATGGQMLQIALITHFLGLRSYGIFAITAALVAIVGRFFDVQVGSAAVAFASPVLDTPQVVARIFRFSYQIDVITGLVAYGALGGVGLIVGDRLGGSEELLLIYGVTLLTAAVETTALALLQLLRQFKSIVGLTLFRELTRAACLGAFLATFGTLRAVVVAAVIVEAAFGLAALSTAAVVFGRRYPGNGLFARTLRMESSLRRAMLRTIFHTNFITYAKLISSQLPTILLGAMRSPVEVGAFKIAMALAAGVGKPADPAWAAALPRLAELWNERRTAETRQLLARSTAIATAVLLAGAVVVFALRENLVRLLAGDATSISVKVLVYALLAQVVSGALFWNSALLVAARQARLASYSYLLTGGILLALLPALISAYGAEGAAGSLLVSTVIGNALLTGFAVQILRRREGASDVLGQAAET